MPRGRTWVGGALAALTLWGGAVAPATAWTRPGHMVSAAIAFDELEASDPEVVDRIVALLDAHPDRAPFEVAEDRSQGRERALRLMMECARWPDDARLTAYDQPSWHVELRPVVRAGDPPATLPDTAVAMDGIEAFALNARVVANAGATPAQRAVALCWMMHLVGDVHQPLHTAQLFSSAYPTGDRAGSLQFVIDPISGNAETLHWVWDDSVHRSGDFAAVAARAAELATRQPRARLIGEHPRATAGDYAAWADESYALARSFAYADGPVGAMTADTARPLTVVYANGMRDIAEIRVAMAGYRLADLLREAFVDA